MDNYQYVGKSFARKDALEKVTGSAVFGADVLLPKMLYAAVVRSPYSHARIKSVDITEASKLPGVKAIVTGKDNPGLFGQFLLDQPVIAYDKVRYEGEPVAAVAAVDKDTAEEAKKLIKVEYEPLTPVVTIDDAIKQDPILLHEKWSSYKMAHAANPVDGTNICDHFKLRKGDVEAGFEESDVIVEGIYEGKMVQHATIEPHCSTALFDDKGLTIWSPTQSPFMTRDQMAKLFNLSLNEVRFICTHIGGAFGGKYELKTEPIAALLASKVKGWAVRIQHTRAEEFLTGGCREPWRIIVKTGAKKDGTLVAQKITIFWDTGAYATTGPRVSYNACYAAVSPYRIPNISIDGYTIVTNKHIATAYRGFGVPEVVWGYENNMEKLAEKLGMDSVELRLKNALVDGDESGTGEILKAVGVRDSIAEAARLMDWNDNFKPGLTPEGKLRGRGLAAFCKITGTPSSTSVILKMNEDGTVVVYLSGLEMGQGATTVIPIIVAEALSISVDKVMCVPVDTLYSPYDKTTTSSRLTFHSGNAALIAAEKIKEQLINLAAIAWKTSSDKVKIENGYLVSNDGEKFICLNEIGKSGILKEQDPVIAVGQYSTSSIFDVPNPETHLSKRPTVMWFWGAQAAEVEVDPQTGKVDVIQVACAHDIGKAINPLGVYQQIEGGVIMGLGHALLEEMIFDDKGKLLNGNMVDFKLPTAMDAKLNLKVSLIESKPHPEGPYGAKGIGEPAMCAIESAIAFAISNAVGVRFTSLPVKADEILSAVISKSKSSQTGGERDC